MKEIGCFSPRDFWLNRFIDMYLRKCVPSLYYRMYGKIGRVDMEYAQTYP